MNNTSNDIVLNVAAKAVIVNSEGKILVLRESAKEAANTNVGRYQLPGGRIEKGEAFLDGLRREVMEETGLEIIPGQPLAVDEWRPVILGVPHQIVGMFMKCKLKGDGAVQLSEEHDDALWINPEDHESYSITEADRRVLDIYAFGS